MQSLSSTLGLQLRRIYDQWNNLLVFILLVYSFSWSLLLSLMGSNQILQTIAFLLPFEIIIIIFPFCPTVIALGILFLTEGQKGVSNLLKKFHVQFERSLMVVIVFFFPVVFLVVSMLTNLFIPAYAPRSIYPHDFFEMVLLFFLLALGGEVGWRGYALDRLQQKYTPMISSIVIGVFWGLFYLPILLSPGFFIHWWNFPILWGIFILVSILITVFYNKSNQSLLASLLLNIAFHLMIAFFYFNYLIEGRLTPNIMIPFFFIPLDLGLMITLLVLSFFMIILIRWSQNKETKILYSQ